MILMETKMAKLDEEGSNGRRMFWMVLSALGIVMTIGAIAGFVAQHQENGGGAYSNVAIAILATFAAVIIALSYAIWHQARKLKASGEGMTKRERLNRNILAACLLAGGFLGLVLTIGDIGDGQAGFAPTLLLGETPLPAWLALTLVFTWAIIMPITGWWWHTRAIDEQEASAYRDGAFVAGYAYLIGAPVWWVLWRGGFVAEPNGVVIFMAFALIWSAVWFWKKYR